MKTLISAATIAALICFVRAAPQSTGDSINAGRAIYLQHCASCHGVALTGHGHAAAVLATPPPDLRHYTNQSTPFPRDRIRNVVLGRMRLVPSHGVFAMPVWRDALNDTNLDALVDYLESVQLRPFGPYRESAADPIADGAMLFQTHCAACHGEDARGEPLRGLLHSARPDLTSIVSRKGVFDLGEAMESIARCNSDEMPSWQSTFGLAGLPPAVTEANLDALARFLASIQIR